MEKQLIISLVSDQTIPNIQIIKEFRNTQTDYIFVLTEAMRKKGVADWILETIGINDAKKILVDEYSIESITCGLQKIEYASYARVIVNLTGGTKIMTLSVFDFFKDRPNVDIYYVTGKGKDYQKIVAGRCEGKIFSQSILLEEYLKAYGFSIKTEPSGISFETTEKIYKHCLEGLFEKYKDAVIFITLNRNRVIAGDDFNKVCDFLCAIEYVPQVPNELSKAETKYLSGEWFEEYVGTRIKNDLQLSDDNILVGTTYYKTITPKQDLNSVSDLLGTEDCDKKIDNELDVIFVKDNTFYVIECKTSIITREFVQKRKNGKLVSDENGQPIMMPKEKNILGETIYKSDALNKKFGLFAKSYIFTLTDLKRYVENDSNKQNNMMNLIKRASLSNIKIVDRQLLIKSHNMCELL